MAKNYYLLIGLFWIIPFLGNAQQGNSVRGNLKKTYTSQIGVRELTGYNDGKQVETYLKYVGLPKGQPWCAAFVSWAYGQNGLKKVRAGGCVLLMEQGKVIYKSGKSSSSPMQGDVFFIWFVNKNRVAHTGFVDAWGNSFVTTVEGNTNEAGSREGDGVYRKKRMKRQIYAVTKYVN